MLADTERTFFSVLLSKQQMPLQSKSLRAQHHEFIRKKNAWRESCNIERKKQKVGDLEAGAVVCLSLLAGKAR